VVDAHTPGEATVPATGTVFASLRLSDSSNARAYASEVNRLHLRHVEIRDSNSEDVRIFLDQAHGLESIVLTNNSGRIDPSGIVHLSSLKFFGIDTYRASMDFSRLGVLSGLEGLTLVLPVGEAMPNLPEFPHLRWLCVHGAAIQSWRLMPTLEELDLTYCKSRLTLLKMTPNLVTLFVGGCDNLGDMRELPRLPRLQNLDLRGCDPIVDLSWIKQMENVRQVSLSGCHMLADLTGLSRLRGLRSLCLDDLRSVTTLAGLSGQTSVEDLEIRFLREVSDLSPLASLPRLRRLSLNGIDVRDLRPLAELENLTSLTIDNCSDIKTYKPLVQLRRLKELNIRSSGGTREEIDELRARLPGCRIEHRNVGDVW
jgi:internalin A